MTRPSFPVFDKVELDSRDVIETYVRDYLPYSDFNFVSLYVYNTDGSNAFTFLNDNLVIRLNDYIKGNPVYSVLGMNKSIDTFNELYRYTSNYINCDLKLIPEDSLQKIDLASLGLCACEDPDSFDYILPLEEIATLDSPNFYSQRKLVHKFMTQYPNAEFTKLDLHSAKVKQEVLELFNTWLMNKHGSSSAAETELIATKRFMDLPQSVRIIATGVYLDSKLIAYYMEELLNNKYVMGHFGKADSTYSGVYQFIAHKSAQHLVSLGYSFLNYEQDLGIPGLKTAKNLWNPVRFLKKYTIEKAKI